jgi:hypothetical protein
VYYNRGKAGHCTSQFIKMANEERRKSNLHCKHYGKVGHTENKSWVKEENRDNGPKGFKIGESEKAKMMKDTQENEF